MVAVGLVALAGRLVHQHKALQVLSEWLVPSQYREAAHTQVLAAAVAASQAFGSVAVAAPLEVLAAEAAERTPLVVVLVTRAVTALLRGILVARTRQAMSSMAAEAAEAAVGAASEAMGRETVGDHPVETVGTVGLTEPTTMPMGRRVV